MIGPFDSLADAAHWRGGEQLYRHDDRGAAREQLLRQVLADAGVTLGAFDEQIVSVIVGSRAHLLAVVVAGWVDRARRAEVPAPGGSGACRCCGIEFIRLDRPERDGLCWQCAKNC